MEFQARNTNDLAKQVYPAFETHGITADSRNGPVIRFPETTMITLTHPWERVNFSPARDANPFFHLMEAMAMIAGFNSVPVLAYYAKNMASFSDDGETFNSFYGTRMHQNDQLYTVIKNLRTNPDSRQELVMLWDPADLTKATKDKACNFAMLFEVFQGNLRMNTFNRSNDAIWGGITGANVVHFSFFQEYVACALNLDMGSWTHTSANLHVYQENPKLNPIVIEANQDEDLTAYPHQRTWLFEAQDFDYGLFREELEAFFSLHEILLKTVDPKSMIRLSDFAFSFKFLQHTVRPMAMTWANYKADKTNTTDIHLWIDSIESQDWRKAAKAWMKRRGI